MPKRRAIGDVLTGGTKDVNPQYLSGTLTLSGANTITTGSLPLPITRVGQSGAARSVIMEILKVFVVMPQIDADGAAVTARNSFFIVSTASFGTVAAQFSDPRIVAYVARNVRNAFTAAGTGTLDVDVGPKMVDVTDGDGHGILVATDNLYIQGDTDNYTAAATFYFKILYRFKEVSLVEYIGIVQSQQ